jgi:hypothetical protein
MQTHTEVIVNYPGDRIVKAKIEGGDFRAWAMGMACFEVLENTFAAFNHGSGRECPEFLESKMRSLSVNDLVRIGTTWYQCESIGWKEVTEQYVDDLEKAVVEHPAYALHGAWFALSELAWERKKALQPA